MGIDLGGGFGAGGAVAGLQQLIAQRYQQRQQDMLAQQQAWMQQFNEKALAQQEELKRAQLADLAQSRAERAQTMAAQEQDRRMGLARGLGDQIPAGATLGLNDPAVGLMQQGGLGALLTKQAPTLPSTQFAGESTLPGALKPQGVLTTKTNAGNPEQYIKEASAGQQQMADANQQKADALARQVAHDAEQARHDRAMENKQPAGATIKIETVDDQGNKVTRIVPKVAGAEYKAPTGATMESRLASAQAVQQTGNDMIAKLNDPKVKAALGPTLGRVNTLRDFIGNPPPEFADLAGQIESYALANLGVHGMRSAEAAKQISALLDKHHTPESLIATIQGLNSFASHLLENAGKKSETGHTAAETGGLPAVGGTFQGRKVLKVEKVQ